jgi:hypothetical protein
MPADSPASLAGGPVLVGTGLAEEVDAAELERPPEPDEVGEAGDFGDFGDSGSLGSSPTSAAAPGGGRAVMDGAFEGGIADGAIELDAEVNAGTACAIVVADVLTRCGGIFVVVEGAAAGGRAADAEPA